MQVKHRQTTRNGCGSLSIANIFDDHTFTVGLEDCKGERIADLNRKLAAVGSLVFIDCIFMTHKFFKTGNRLKKTHCSMFTLSPKGATKIIRDKYAVPYLFTIANRVGKNPHMVGVVHNISTGMFHLIDSSKPEILVMTFTDMVKRFHIIGVALFRFIDYEDHGAFVMMPKSELPHIFE